MAQPRRATSAPAREAGQTQAAPPKNRSSGKKESSRAGAKRSSADTRTTSSPASLHGWTASQAWETVVRVPAGRLLESTSGAVPLEACTAAILLLYLLLLGLGCRALLRWLRRLSGGHARSSSKCVVLLGPSGGGKTSLFLLLRNGKVTPTLPSMQENVETLRVEEDGKDEEKKEEQEGRGGRAEKKKDSSSSSSLFQVVDFPGHAKLQVLAAPYIDRASAVIFLVDAADKKSFKTAAEQLYDLFTKTYLHEQQVPLLLVINKADLPDARSDATVIEDLEREIERSRASRGALLEGEDDATNFIGVEGEVFKFFEHAPFPVEICSASVKNGDIAAIRDFLLRRGRTDKAK